VYLKLKSSVGQGSATALLSFYWMLDCKSHLVDSCLFEAHRMMSLMMKHFFEAQDCLSLQVL